MYVTLSDLHLHKWSSFSKITEEGLNSRLSYILDEIYRANTVLQSVVKGAGPGMMVLGGDIFHVRGKISPEVLNPVLECFEAVVGSGTRVVGISGNHDLESNSANDLSSSATALRAVGVEIFNEPTKVEHDGHEIVLVPYIDGVEELKGALTNLCADNPADGCDLVIHAPVDGVIKGLPDHGLSPEFLADLGFKRVFAGHYHNHKDFGNGVYSIGATTHQTWSDINTKAGFLIVDDDDGVKWQASHAPSFVELDPETEKDEVPLVVDGNYVRVTMEIEKDSQVAEMRDFLIESGAKGVLINRIKKETTISRTGATASSGKSIEVSVGEFITSKKYKNQKALLGLCGSIISSVEVSE